MIKYRNFSVNNNSDEKFSSLALYFSLEQFWVTRSNGVAMSLTLDDRQRKKKIISSFYLV